MAEQIKLSAVTRTISGSSAVRRMRRQGILPGSVSSENRQARMIQLERHGFELMLHRHMSENLIVDMSVDGEGEKKVLLKEVQHDPITEEILHVDFVEISMTRKMRARIRISLAGEPVGVSQEGGILELFLREIEVECLPGDLVEQVTVDVSSLKIGDNILVGDLTVDPKLAILTPRDVAVAGVTAPRVEEEPAPAEAEAAAAEGAEPEVIGEKKEGKEEEAAGDEKEG